jgi:hypothetical protein
MVTDMPLTPQQHAERIAGMLRQVEQECRADCQGAGDPGAKVLFETLAEVLEGSVRALQDYVAQRESAPR